MNSAALCLQVWHCTEKSQTELDAADVGRFFSQDSYVVLYRRSDKRESYIMYFWQGASARAVRACSCGPEVQ